MEEPQLYDGKDEEKKKLRLHDGRASLLSILIFCFFLLFNILTFKIFYKNYNLS